MRLKKIIAYVDEEVEQEDGQEGIRTTIIPSGFKGGFIIVEEDYGYNLGVAYYPMSKSKELLKAIREVRKKSKIERR